LTSLENYEDCTKKSVVLAVRMSAIWWAESALIMTSFSYGRQNIANKWHFVPSKAALTRPNESCCLSCHGEKMRACLTGRENSSDIPELQTEQTDPYIQSYVRGFSFNVTRIVLQSKLFPSINSWTLLFKISNSMGQYIPIFPFCVSTSQRSL